MSLYFECRMFNFEFMLICEQSCLKSHISHLKSN